MLKLIIVEDDPSFIRRLTEYLKRYESEHEAVGLSVESYSNAVDFLTAYRCDADLLLMDIQMPGMLGIDAAKKVREMDSRVMIIFITTLTQYAIDGYSVGALDYILKPLHYPVFSAKMDRALRMIAHEQTQVSIEVRTKKEVRRIGADEILYIEVSNHDILIHTDQGVITQWGNLKTFEAALSGAHFARCNACYLVNLKFIRGINGDFAELPGEKLAISKPKRKEFLNAVAQYKGGSR